MTRLAGSRSRSRPSWDQLRCHVTGPGPAVSWVGRSLVLLSLCRDPGPCPHYCPRESGAKRERERMGELCELGSDLAVIIWVRHWQTDRSVWNTVHWLTLAHLGHTQIILTWQILLSILSISYMCTYYVQNHPLIFQPKTLCILKIIVIFFSFCVIVFLFHIDGFKFQIIINLIYA